jgi:hypothetical protein
MLRTQHQENIVAYDYGVSLAALQSRDIACACEASAPCVTRSDSSMGSTSRKLASLVYLAVHSSHISGTSDRGMLATGMCTGDGGAAISFGRLQDKVQHSVRPHLIPMMCRLYTISSRRSRRPMPP